MENSSALSLPAKIKGLQILNILLSIGTVIIVAVVTWCGARFYHAEGINVLYVAAAFCAIFGVIQALLLHLHVGKLKRQLNEANQR
jgi:hypothetical protein